MSFSKDFMWGSATSAYQVEGAVTEDGKGLNCWDVYSGHGHNTQYNETGEIACDHYHRMKEDVKLMADLGIKAYRFSIAWSRVLPDGTVYNTSVLTCNETPGLGAKCTSDAGFMNQWKNLTPDKVIKVKKDGGDIDAITASTITSRAYALAVSNAVEFVKSLAGTNKEEGQSYE